MIAEATPPVTVRQFTALAIDNGADRSTLTELVGRPAMVLADGLDYFVRPQNDYR